ncbi:MAG: helicase [Rhodothermaceae bacterium]|nr:helicase [Rhodothermaceae bacterium]MYE62857.1 helicase [Rhodothermaceae bacterium]MYJ21605.1 helicase [Rhodothermaceae bacterium]
MTTASLEPGRIAHVRQRRYLIEKVVQPPSPGDATLVGLSCLDDDAQGDSLSVLWEHELDAEVLQDDGWSNVAEKGFDDPEVFTAYLRTLSWNCVTATDPRLFQSPFRAGIRIDAYQLEPLRKALKLPRVNLFIADDVGLGKTIEAGLIARELLLRRRIDRIVVACPPAMLDQWQDEMETRFGLRFRILDRAYLNRMRRERGFSVNPWTTHSYFLVSHRLLIDEAYASGLRDWLGEFAPQSLLILDEAHHVAPASSSRYAIDSKITRAIRDLSPRFEHRLFLSATPHNGHSNSFSALLEILDPQRFCRGVQVLKSHLNEVLIRRLKSDIREIAGGFPRRNVVPVVIDGLPLDAPELVLPKLLNHYRLTREQRLKTETKFRQAAGSLVIGGLQKRMLSSIEAFAKTLAVHRMSVEKAMEKAIPPSEISKSDQEYLKPLTIGEEFDEELMDPESDPHEGGSLSEPGFDDRMVQATTASTDASREGKQTALKRELDLIDQMIHVAELARHNADERVRTIIQWIEDHMCPDLSTAAHPQWNERRLLIFTEYEDTRRWLQRHLEGAIRHSDQAHRRIAVFTGNTHRDQREEIKAAFNKEPGDHPLRILIATDAAREGINLQRHCHDLFHFDLPWNPSRLDQRNGRIDRKLQPAAEVFCRYFIFRQRAEDRVLAVLMNKITRIREELGSASKVLEDRLAEKITREGIRHGDVDQLERDIRDLSADAKQQTIEDELEDETRRQADLQSELDTLRKRLEYSRRHIDLTDDKLHQALSVSLKLAGASGIKEMVGSDDRISCYSFPAEDLAHYPDWTATLDTLRARKRRRETFGEWRRRAPIREITFADPEALGENAVQLHLEHRVVKRLLGRFTAQGLVHHILSKACLTVASDAIPRVVLLGRLALYGPGAARLHEEIVPITARWIDTDIRQGPLVPYGRSAEQITLNSLQRALGEVGWDRIPDQVEQHLKDSVKRDIESLLPHLERRAEDLAEKAKRRLSKRAGEEKHSMVKLLESQRKRIAEAVREYDEFLLDILTDGERHQREADHRAWKRRLREITQELDDEPRRIDEIYTVHATRVDPVGLVYLWPRTG